MYFAFDCETTGLNPDHNEILQLSAIIIDDNFNEIKRGELRLEPKYPERASVAALEKTGIDLRTWKATHSCTGEALQKMIDFVLKYGKGNLGYFGQNVDFDINFLDALMVDYGRNIFIFNKAKKLDLMQMYQMWCLVHGKKFKKLKLENICEMIGVENKKAHSAMEDIEATVIAGRKILNDLKKKNAQ